ncbi:MAG: hypothetical protein PF542_03110 [Nanoarchaeota archaeon]|jgi:tRNA (guanine37-N1)-methyltransferase|nr:hypothetical protein [Nanoarchaeota archaeon]
MVKQRSFSVYGNVAIVNFPDDSKAKDKKEFAKGLLLKNKAIRTVLEKSGRFSGRLRKQKTRHLAGEKTKEVLYRENGCVFRFNIDETYFSSRLANERNEACKLVRAGDEVLVMFAGVAPFPIVIAKNTKAAKVYSNELNRAANKYAEMNIKKNKLGDRVELLPGDIKKVAVALAKESKTFDLIMMTRPNLEESFLPEAFMLSKKGTRIYYHAFCHVDDRGAQIEMIKKKAVEAGKEIKILGTKNIGDIAPGKVRFRIYFEVANSRPFLARIKDFYNSCRRTT